MYLKTGRNEEMYFEEVWYKLVDANDGTTWDDGYALEELPEILEEYKEYKAGNEYKIIAYIEPEMVGGCWCDDYINLAEWDAHGKVLDVNVDLIDSANEDLTINW